VKTYALAAQKPAVPWSCHGLRVCQDVCQLIQLYWSMCLEPAEICSTRSSIDLSRQDPAALHALEWIVPTMNDWQILDPRSGELNLDQARIASAGQLLFADTPSTTCSG